MTGFPDDQPPRPSAGAVSILTLADPPVNTGFQFVVPAGELWRPVLLCFVTTALGSGVQWRLTIARGGVPLAIIPMPSPVLVAPTSVTYSRNAGTAYSESGARYLLPLPDIGLIAADTITFAGPGGGDNIGPPTLSYELLAV